MSKITKQVAMAHLEALLEVATDPTDTMPVWQGEQARMYATVNVAELQALARHAEGEAVAPEALARLRDILRDASSPCITLRVWQGPSKGYTTSVSAGELALLAGVEVAHG
jgi:hypothetical protein